MKHVYKFLLILLSFQVNNNSIAQNDSSSKKSVTKFNINYLSNAVYFARKDSSPVPYLRSLITYNGKSGFYASAGVALLVSGNVPARIDLINLDGGYNFSMGKFDAGVYASKFFYSNASYAVASEIKGMTGFYGSYNPGIVSIGTGGYLMFSTHTDLGSYLSLSHTFEHGEENNHWTFVPALQANAGTQYFNEAYYETRKFTFPTTTGNSGSNGNGNGNSSGKGSSKGHSNSSNSGSSTTTTTVRTLTFYDKNRFTILDLELSIPINYEKKHWGIYANPVIAIPTSPATFAIDNAIQKENLSTVFFTEIGAYLKF